MAQNHLGSTFGDCKPWNTNRTHNDINLLNNLTSNLHSYEQLIRKRSGNHQFPQLRKRTPASTAHLKAKPSTIQKNKTNTLEHTNEPPRNKASSLWNRSIELHGSKSDLALAKTNEAHRRGRTALEALQPVNRRENKDIPTERIEGKRQQFQWKKGCLLSFEELSKCKRLKKRQIHQMIFGSGKRQRNESIKEIR